MKLLTLILVTLAAAMPFSVRAEPAKTPVKTIALNDCKESTDSEGAAFTRLECPPVGSYDLYVLEQNPTVFTVQLTRNEQILETGFIELTHGLPLESGKWLEWHLQDGEPQFLLVPLKWGSEKAPFQFKEYITINHVASDRICTLAVIARDGKSDSRQRARDLLATVGKLEQCPPVPEKLL